MMTFRDEKMCLKPRKKKWLYVRIVPKELLRSYFLFATGGESTIELFVQFAKVKMKSVCFYFVIYFCPQK